MSVAKCSYHHLQGPLGLNEAVTKILDTWVQDKSKPRPILIFDFDRTLTNGFAAPEPDLHIDRRIRGGQPTLDALLRAKTEGAMSFVVTARSATKLTIEQLEASMMKCQSELAKIFTDSGDAAYHVEKVNGRPLAWRGRLFASDYAKPIALQQILAELEGDDLISVHFFDDYVMNAFDIGVGDYGSRVATISTYWWDTFLEEQNKTIGSVYSFSSDFPYQKGCEAALEAFGIDLDQMTSRRAYYLEFETANNIKPREKEELPAPKSLKDHAKASLLASKLNFGGPRLPPPKDSTPGYSGQNIL